VSLLPLYHFTSRIVQGRDKLAALPKTEDLSKLTAALASKVSQARAIRPGLNYVR
jgi:hypothetical protein